MEQKIEHEGFFSLLDWVLKRRELFQIESVNDIELLLNGYILGMRNRKDPDIDKLPNFKSLVKKKFNSNDTNSWSNTIRYYSKSNSHSIDVFQELLKEFQKGLL